MLSNRLIVLDAQERHNDLKVAQKQKAAVAKLPVKSTSCKILNPGRKQSQKQNSGISMQQRGEPTEKKNIPGKIFAPPLLEQPSPYFPGLV